METPNPYQPPPSPNPFADRPEAVQLDQRAIEEAARLLVRDKHDHTTSWQLFAMGIIGCFSPILAIYGIIFLLRRPYSFPLKGLAIAGTVLHCAWAVLTIGWIALSIYMGQR